VVGNKNGPFVLSSMKIAFFGKNHLLFSDG
jgi:hypothetical protein